MPRRHSLALGLLVAAIPLAGCGSSDPELIPQTRASALLSTADEIKSACDAGDTAKAKAAVTAANQQVSELPRLQGRGDAEPHGHAERDRDPDGDRHPHADRDRDPDAVADRDGDPHAERDGGTSGQRRCPCS